MAIPSPQAGADAWGTGVSGAQAKWQANTTGTTKDPTQLAVAAQAALLANFTQAINSGLWASRLLARGKQYWINQVNARAGNYGASATYGKSNYLSAAQQLYPYESTLQAQVDSMPSGTRADSLARFTTWMDGMIAFKSQYIK